MWTNTNGTAKTCGIWQPNHFVPLIRPKQVLPAPIVLASDTDKESIASNAFENMLLAMDGPVPDYNDNIQSSSQDFIGSGSGESEYEEEPLNSSIRSRLVLS